MTDYRIRSILGYIKACMGSTAAHFDIEHEETLVEENDRRSILVRFKAKCDDALAAQDEECVFVGRTHWLQFDQEDDDVPMLIVGEDTEMDITKGSLFECLYWSETIRPKSEQAPCDPIGPSSTACDDQHSPDPTGLVIHDSKGRAYSEDQIAAIQESIEKAAPAAVPIATIQAPDPEDERVGVWLSLGDKLRLGALPVGTKLYTHPAAPPAGWKLVPVEPVKSQQESAAFNLCNDYGPDYVMEHRIFALDSYRHLVLTAPEYKEPTQ